MTNVFRTSLALLAAHAAGDSTLWIDRFLPVLIAIFIATRLLRRFAFKSRRVASSEPVIPTHPVVLPPGRLGPRPDQTKGLLLPIESVRELLGPAPRQYTKDIQKYLAITPPPWLNRRSKDELQLAFRSQDRIRRDGNVVWAAIVQANSLLFRRGSGDCPASVIFSLDPWYDTRPDELQTTAHELFDLKGTDQNDPDTAAVARVLTNELTRAMMLRVPRRFTEGRHVFHSSIMLPRKHLPKGYLSGSLFPVWVDPSGSGALILVPAAYWPASLTSMWDHPAQTARS